MPQERVADRAMHRVPLSPCVLGARNTVSQRVALAAGFTPAGTAQSRVPATGETYDDLRFVLRRR